MNVLMSDHPGRWKNWSQGYRTVSFSIQYEHEIDHAHKCFKNVNFCVILTFILARYICRYNIWELESSIQHYEQF